MADDSEIDRLDPEPAEVKLVSGFAVEVVRLRTRQLFRLMRIISRGATPAAMSQLNFGADDPEGQKEFAGKLLGMIVMAIPDAENEAIGFLQSMTQPAGIIQKTPAKLNKQESEHNDALFERYGKEMFNPELEDTLSLLEVIIAIEAPEIQALGKKLSHLWKVARKAMGADLPAEPPEGPDLHLQGIGQPSSMSSPSSTDGATSTSSTSRSAASGRRARPSPGAGS
jgi:hypothetical protein